MKTKTDKTAACALLLLLGVCLAGCTDNKSSKDVTNPELTPIETEEAVSLKKDGSENVQEEEKASAPVEKVPQEPRPDMSFSEAVNTFNWNFYDTRDTGSNIFYSPISLESALAMTLAGAKNDTFDELAYVLCIKDADAFMNDYSSLSAGYTGDSAKLTTANSLWIDETFEKQYGIDPGFISKLEEKMGAEVIMEDFKNNSGKASADISDWVDSKTDGLLKDYQSISDSNTVLDIINAIYFFGEWKSKFDANDTYESDFRTKNGTKSVKMMNMHNEYFRYHNADGFMGIELPYADDSAVMDIILSSDDNDLSTPESFKSLSAAEREDFFSKLSSSEEVRINSLQLPKFTMDISCEGLKETLQNMGLYSAFDPQNADFSGIAEKIYISDIAHRAKIEVDEEGSRAAAVTEITMNVTGMLIEDELIEFICDRPFVFVIRDRATGTILFTGAVNEP